MDGGREARIAAPQREKQMIQLNSNELRRLDHADGVLQYAVAGDGEPVIFIHGFGLDSEMWAPQWPVFAERYRTIRYDLRGYGRSSLPEGAYSHVDLLALIDFLGAANHGRALFRLALVATRS